MGYNSDGVFTAGKCLNELINLNEIKGGMFSAAKKRSKLGYLEAIASPLNMSGQRQIPTQQGTKKRIVEIRWRQRVIVDQVEESLSGTCTSTDFPDFNSELFEVSKYAEYKFALNQTEFNAVCEGRSEFINESIELAYDALARRINGALLTEQLTNFGINIASGSSATTSVDVFPAATGAPNAAALQTLLFEYDMENEMVGTPIWVGGGNIYKYWKTLEQACCNDGGINMLDLSNSLGYAPFADTMVDGIIGANQFIVLEPQSVQFVTFNDYTGENATSSGTSVARGTITDSKTGITYDIKVLQDDCSDDWVVIMNINYDIFFQPGEAFQADDPLFGTNGTLRYTAATT
jgi:hypothetical protein